MEDWFPRGVFGKHPHRSIETVTYVVEGRIDHYDNQGHEGTILPGDVQWMTTGRGLIHNEIPAEGVTVHSLQLWGNLPAADKMTGPRYQDLADDAVPVGRQPGVVVRVFFGASVGRPTSCGRWRCSASRTSMTGAWAAPTIEPLSPSYCACG
jgi:redox-sensitive bicupin YhaK (pirin superfamily)